MNTSQCSVRFFLGDSRVKKSKTAKGVKRGTTVYLYFRYYANTGNDKKRCTIKIPTSVKTHPNDWNKTEDKIKPGRPGELSENAVLFKIKSDLKTAWAQLHLNSKDISVDEMRTIARNAVDGFKVVDTQNTFKIAFDEFINYLTVIERSAPSTIVKYKNMNRHLGAFGKFSGRAISFESIDLGFYESFQAYLFDEEEVLPKDPKVKHQRGKEKMKKNTVGKNLKLLKRFLKFCHDRGITDQVHYIRFKSFSEKPDTLALTYDELKRIETLDLSEHPRLVSSRDAFIFMCYTACRINELKSLHRNDIHGTFWRIHDKKTNEVREAVLLPEALEILERYKNHLQPLKIKSEQIFNKEIKDICKEAGITDLVVFTELVSVGKERELKRLTVEKWKKISTHTARRTFITLSRYRGMSDEAIKSVSGHKTSQMLNLYDKSTPEMNAEKVYREWQKAI